MMGPEGQSMIWITGHRDLTPGQGPTRYFWILAIILTILLHGTYAPHLPKSLGVLHQFTSYDCERPTSVQALKLPSHCLNKKPQQ